MSRNQRNPFWAFGFILLVGALPANTQQLAWKAYEGSQFSFDYPAAWEAGPPEPPN